VIKCQGPLESVINRDVQVNDSQVFHECEDIFYKTSMNLNGSDCDMVQITHTSFKENIVLNNSVEGEVGTYGNKNSRT
jgi:hypothetical protein